MGCTQGTNGIFPLDFFQSKPEPKEHPNFIPKPDRTPFSLKVASLDHKPCELMHTYGNFAETLEMAESSGSPFTDQEQFPPEPKSLFEDPAKTGESGWDGAEWVRVRDIAAYKEQGEPLVIFGEEIGPKNTL